VRFGLDYSGAGMTVQALRGVGADFVCRYLSTPGNPKNITAGEALEMSHAAIDIVLVFETTAERALRGRGAGAADARSAARQAQAVGMPQGRPIYFAVDFDATPEQQTSIDEYFRGVSAVLGLRAAGAYAGYWVIKRLFDARLIRWGWQTYAWSGGNWDPRAQLQQFSNSHTVGGIECDYNHATTQDFGQWRTGHSPPAPPSNPHTPLATDGILGGRTVAAMQWALHVPDDGVFGAQTKRALQRHLGVAQDGMLGPATVEALQRHIGATVDGIWGPETTRRLQEALNSDGFS
jgi:peptidoglycan hydrolase-like protein with peptidoglycan-binding domain